MIFSCTEKNFNYPKTRKDNTVDNYFGTKVADPYRWLEDDNSDETKAWVKAENKVTFDYLHKIPARKKIINRLSEVLNYERYSTPIKKSGRYFYFKNNGLQNQSVLYTLKNLSDKPKVLLDPNKLSDDGTVALSGYSISKNGKYLAYSVSRGGSDWKEIFIKDIETGKTLKDKLRWVKFSGMTWYKNGFFYGRYPATKKGAELTTANKNQKIYYHKVNTNQTSDSLVYQNPSHPNRMYGTAITSDEKYLFLSESETTSGNGFYFKDLTKKGSKFIQLAKGFDYDYGLVDFVNGKFIIQTNQDAQRYKLVAVDPKNPAKAFWKDFIPEQKNVLQWCKVGGDKVIVGYMKDAYSKVKLYDFNGKFIKNLDIPGIGTIGGFSAKKDENTAFYSFSSFTIPPSIYKYNMKTGETSVYRKPTIKGFNFDDYVTKQVFFKSYDGTKVPMFITHKKGIKYDGYNPCLLYAYGGFNISVTPRFSVTRMTWLEKGGIYVVANIRGGGEYGDSWHKDGTLLKKQNVFDDFISAAEHLIANKYTSQSRLVIEGGSNGGLLMGAVANQRPDLFKVVLAHVGVMDMLRYQNFTIGRAWSSDYGLSEDSVMFEYLYKYSPLHNIKKDVEYPAILVLTGDHDDIVVPAHSCKYIATLQEKYKGENPVMIRIETDAGHGAGKPLKKVIEEYADIYAFIFDNLGIKY